MAQSWNHHLLSEHLWNASNTEIVSVKLTFLSAEDVDMLSSGFTRREVREKRIIRLFREGYLKKVSKQ